MNTNCFHVTLQLYVLGSTLSVNRPVFLFFVLVVLLSLPWSLCCFISLIIVVIVPIV